MPFEIPTDLPSELLPLAWMIGRWEGVGLFSYPTIEDGRFGQELEIRHDGRPFLEWHSHTWELDEQGHKVRPRATELGFLRPVGEESKECELLLAHSTGIVEMYYGTVEPARLIMKTDGVMRSPHAKEYSAGSRMYGYVNGELFWAMDMAAEGHALQTHLSAQLKRVS